MSQTFVILFLSLWTITIGKPGLFDFIDNCESISDPSVCAILYDDENCNEGDWTPYRVKDGEQKSFSILKDLTNAFSGPKNDVESIVVRRGCTLRVYKDSDFSDGEYVFSAPTNTDLFIKDLEDDSSTEYLNEEIESVKCNCFNQGSGNTFDPTQKFNPQVSPALAALPESCQNIASQYPQYGAIVFDDEECKVDDWDEPLGLVPGQDKSWGLFSNPTGYAKYANTIESVYVKRGCALTVYDDDEFSDDPFTFEARGSDIVVTLDSPPSRYSSDERDEIESLDDDIQSMKLQCGLGF